MILPLMFHGEAVEVAKCQLCNPEHKCDAGLSLFWVSANGVTIDLVP